MNSVLVSCRDLYNSLLLWRISEWDKSRKNVGYYDQSSILPEWRKNHPELKSVYAQVLQNVAMRVDLTFKYFFKRCKSGEKPGFPRFKGDNYDSFTYPQPRFTIGECSIALPKIGNIKAIIHRQIEGRIKTCTVSRNRDKWYVCLAVEVDDTPLESSDEAIGIDVGIKEFAALSNGEMIANPRFFRKDEKALAKAQRKLSNQKRGSKERRKAKKVVYRINERTRNRRHNFIHQTTRNIVNRFGFIAVEKLNIQNMQGNHNLAKSIADASWGMFRRILASKAESAGRKYVEVNPAWTSQDCSGCGTRVKKKLSERVHYCPNCGLSLDRDTNAALNILRIGMGQHTVSGMPE